MSTFSLWEHDDRCRHAIVDIAGITFDNENGRARQDVLADCSEGEMLQLIADPDNPYDSNAVKVCRLSGDQLGFVPAWISPEIYKLAEKGYAPNAILMHIETSDYDGKAKYGEIVLFFFLGGSISRKTCNNYIQDVLDKEGVDYQSWDAFRPDQ